MANSTWDPKQYEKFKQQRFLPFLDLMNLVQPQDAMNVIDLGCGTGENTKTLHDKLGAALTLGIDQSETMLAKSGAFQTDGLSFREYSIENFTPDGPVDLVFSNAALHFVKDHETLFPRLASWLGDGGQFAAHLPSNHTYPTHTIVQELGAEERYQSALGGENYTSAVLLPERYAEILHECGFTEQTVRLNIYTHELPDAEAVYEWVKGSLLTWYQKRMPERVFEQFRDEYKRRLLERLGEAQPFFFTFRRLLIWGRK